MHLFIAPIEVCSAKDLEKKYGTPIQDKIIDIVDKKDIEEGELSIIDFPLLSLTKEPFYKTGTKIRQTTYRVDDVTKLHFGYVLNTDGFTNENWKVEYFYLYNDEGVYLSEDTLFRKPYLNYSFEQLIGFLGEPIYDSIRDSVYLTQEKFPDFIYNACGMVTGSLRRTAWKIGVDYVFVSFAECYDCTWKPYHYYIGDKIIHGNF
jgi:hypothetical protein